MDLVNRYKESASGNVMDPIVHSLQPLFEEARANGLLFFSYYQELWFTPDQLEEHLANGKFVWGPANWQLRPASEKPNY